MNTLQEQKFIRGERQRKQDLYRLMLDQQVSYNQQNKNLSTKQSLRTNQYEEPQNMIGEMRFDESHNQQRYFPAIKQSRRGHSLQYKEKLSSSIRQSSQQDKTQIYLSNCEQIIKNLRELKQKKNKIQTFSFASRPSFASEQDHNTKIGVQYYPRSNHFTSQGMVFNKSVTPGTLKYKEKDRLKTLQDSEDSNQQEKESQSKKKYLLRKRQVENIGSRGKSLDRYSFNDTEEKRQQISVPSESDTPSGLKYPDLQMRIPSNQIKKQQLNSIKLQQRHQMKGLNVPKKVSQFNKEKSYEVQEQLKQQRELTSCIMELTRFLKAQNQQKQELKNTQLSFKRQTKTQQVSIQAAINPQSQQTDRQESNRKHYNNFDALKKKTIHALKQLNKKSEQFMNLSSSKQETFSEQQKLGNIDEERSEPNKSSAFFNKDKEISLREKSDEVQSNHNFQEKPLVQKSPCKSFSIEQQFSLRSSQDNLKENAISVNASKEDKNNELVKLLMNHLERQQSKSEELSYCLKQLTDYLKDQNFQMEQLKNSREHQLSERIPSQVNQSAQELKQIEEQEEDEDMNKLQSSQKIQSAVLKNLKKARMKGSLFKQKVQLYRKQHQRLKFLSPSSQKQSSHKEKQAGDDKVLEQKDILGKQSQKQQKNIQQPILDQNGPK